jgi:hypothetical protein
MVNIDSDCRCNSVFPPPGESTKSFPPSRMIVILEPEANSICGRAIERNQRWQPRKKQTPARKPSLHYIEPAMVSVMGDISSVMRTSDSTVGF